MLTVVSLFHFSNSGEASKVIRLDFVKEGKTVIFFPVRIQPFCLQVTLMQCCSNANNQMMS